MERNILEILEARAKATPDKIVYNFLEDGETVSEKISYKELRDQSVNIARYMLKEGLYKERALLLYPSGIDFVIALFACFHAGVIAVPAYPPRRNRLSKRIKGIFDNAAPKIVFTSAGTKINSDEFFDGVDALPILTTNTVGQQEEIPLPAVNNDDVAFLQYTSGSTGIPKGVIVTHSNIVNNVLDIKLLCNSTPNDVLISWLPVFHDMGLIFGVLHPFYCDFPAYIMPPSVFIKRPLKWLKAISKYKGTHSAAPNFAYDICLNIKEEFLQELNLEKWRNVINGAEPIRKQTLKDWAEKFKTKGFRDEFWMPSYGLAENTLYTTSLSLPHKPKVYKLPDSSKQAGEGAAQKQEQFSFVGCGRTGKGSTVIIFDPEKQRKCKDDEVGEIWISGKSVAKGYWQNPEATKEVFENYLPDGEGPFLRTGDLGFMNAGELVVTGRIKDLIIIGGKNLYPQDLEYTAENSHKSLRNNASAAFSVFSESGEKLIIVLEIVRSDWKSFDGSEIVARIQENLLKEHGCSAHALLLIKPFSICKTSSGKIQRSGCKKEYLEEGLNTLYAWSVPSNENNPLPVKEIEEIKETKAIEYKQAKKWLIKTVSTLLKVSPQNIKTDQPLSFYGLNSVKVINLSGNIEDHFNKDFSPVLVYDYPTIDALAGYLSESANKNENTSQDVPDSENGKEAIAVIGMECRFPGAKGVNEFWNMLKHKKSGIQNITQDRFSQRETVRQFQKLSPKYKHIKTGGYLDTVSLFDPGFFGISPNEAYSMDPQHRLLLEVCWGALENGGITKETIKGQKVGVFIGISTNEYYHLQCETKKEDNVYLGTGNAASIAASRISYFLDLKGPGLAIDTACSSALVAVHMACQSILNGECHTAIVGGVNLILTPELSKVFSDAGMLSVDGKSRPFDNNTNGYVRGEGCGVLILKAKTKATKDNNKVYACIKGSAVNQDGRSNGLTAPSGLAQQNVIRAALQNAKITPEAVSYIETHGTGTALGDPIEFNAINAVYGTEDRQGSCLLGAVKSNIGHLEAAAGMAGLIKTILILKNKMVLPTLNLSTINSRIPLDSTPFEIPLNLLPYDRPKRIAGVSSFGFGGTNAHVIIENAPDNLIPIEKLSGQSKDVHLLTISAKSEASLKSLVEKYIALFNSYEKQDLEAICYSSSIFRTHFEYRFACSGKNKQDLLKQLYAFLNKNKQDVHKANYNKMKPLFLFGGQGTQYPAMGLQLYQTSDLFKSCMDQCDEIFSHHLDYSILEILFNSPAKLNQTLFIQPLVFAIEYALAKLWMSWGIMPAGIAGHSLGEYVGACVANVFSLEDACALVAKRAKLMQHKTGNGKMLAITASTEEVEKHIAAYKEVVAIAAINSKENIVISGSIDAVDTIEQKLSSLGINCQFLKVEQAFHSPLMKGIITEFEQLLNTITFNKPEIKFFSALTGEQISDHITSPDYWSRHITEPVNFCDMVSNINQHDFSYCIELSPHPVLTNLLLENNCSFSDNIYPSLNRKYSAWQTLLESLAGLYTLGETLKWKEIYASFDCSRVELPNYSFQKQAYWLEPTHGKKEQETNEVKSLVHSNNTETKDNFSRIKKELQELVGDMLGIAPNQLSIDIPLLEIGADSIVLLRILKKIEQLYAVKITPREIFEKYRNLVSIATYITENTTKLFTEPTLSTEGRKGVEPEYQARDTNLQENIKQASGSATNTVEELMKFQLDTLKSTIDQQLDIIRNSTKVVPQNQAPAIEEKPVIYDTRLLEEHKPLTAQQQLFLKEFISRFVAKTKSSKEYAQKYRPVLSDWINTIDFRKSLKEISYPILSKGSQGVLIWDADGNEYIDLAIGYGVNYFGSKPDFIIQAIKNQIEEGFELAVQSDLAGEVATLICELTGAERVTFSNTGTEAVMAAIRIARAVTGRKKVVVFNGYYHGTFDGNLARKNFDNDDINGIPVAPGTPYEFVQNVIVLEPGAKRSIEIIEKYKNDIAAILIEPVQSRRPNVFPIDFLRQLRAVATALDITLIFDEIITGFRIHPGGTQALLGFKADITTYGKIVGGGMPIGIIAGKSKFLDAIDGGKWNFEDDSVPQAKTTIFGGTFCKHPVALAAAAAVLRHMKEQGSKLQERVNDMTSKFAEEVNTFFDTLGIDIQIANFGSLFRFQSQGKYNSLLRPIELDIFFKVLLEKGVYTWERRICFLSVAHTSEDIARVVQKIKESVFEMIDGGFFPEAKIKKNASPKIPLLQAQEQLLRLADYSPQGSIGYNITTTIKLEGKLDRDSLQIAFQEVVKRNEALRIKFDKENNCQIICKEVLNKINIRVIEPVKNGQLNKEAFISRYANEETQIPFDLYQGPLFRMTLLEVDKHIHVLIFSGHHIIYDGWSASAVLMELAEIYSAIVRGETMPDNNNKQFSEYIYEEKLRVNSPEFETAKNFWINQFSKPDTLFEFPGDHRRPAMPQYGGMRIRRLLDKEKKDKFIEVGINNGSTPFMTFLAAFSILLYRLSGKNQVLIGVPVNGRKSMDESKMVGFAASILPVFIDLEKEMSFVQVLSLVKKAVINAFEFKDCSLPYFINEIKKQNNTANSGLISVVFNMDSNAEIPDFHGLKAALDFTPINFTTHDLGVDLINFEDTLQIECDFSTELYQDQTILLLLDCYETIISELTNNITMPISKLAVLNELQKNKILFEFNPKEKKFRNLKSFPALFSSFSKYKDGVAAVCGKNSISYKELDKKSNQTAELLINLGLQKGDLVALYRNRDISTLIVMVGILKCGGVYVPLDHNNTLTRTHTQLNNCQARYLITNCGFIEKQPELFRNIEQVSHVICLDQPTDSQKIEQILLPQKVSFLEDIEKQPGNNVEVKCELSDPAYLLYTSGSTGNPKGALLSHGGAVNHILAEFDDLKLKGKFAFLQSANISSDIHVWQFLAPLIRGGKVVIVSKDELLDFKKIIDIIQKNEVTLIEWVPSYITGFLDFIETKLEQGEPTNFAKLKWMILTGEEVSVEVVNRWLKHFPKVKVLNAYGPCEASDDIVQHKITKPLAPMLTKVPIGKPIANMNVFVVDDNMELLPPGYIGEIVVSGIGVGLGYYNETEKTKESFLPNPFDKTLGKTIYKTGDLGKWMPDGTLIFIGRKDQQVQIRGMRVELGEIEAVLRKHLVVKDAVVLYNAAENNASFLQAFLVFEYDKENIDKERHIENLRRYLQEHLPGHMVPAILSVIEEFPINLNGKIDRLKLPETPVLFSSENSDYKPPRNEAELKIVEIWESILKRNKIGINDNFFDLGGHSLLATRVVSEVRQQFNKEISVAHIFSKPTTALLAEFLSGKDYNNTLPDIKAVKRSAILPLSFAQERLWFLDKLEGSIHYHMPAVLRFSGVLDRQVLEYAFREIVNRHEVLRTIIQEENGVGVQVIKQKNEWQLGYSEISNSNVIEELIYNEVRKPFSLSEDYLLRGHLIQKSDTEHLLVFVLHHIISDGWSESVLLQELIELYQAKKEQRNPTLQHLSVQYADYAIWQRNYLKDGILENKLQYWEQQLAGAEPLNLPVDYLRPTVQSIKGKTLRFSVDNRLKEKLHALARKEEVSLFMLLLSVFKIMLHRYCRQDDICIGSPVANRNQKDLEYLIGFFINTLVLRSHLNSKMNFKTFVAQVKATTLQAYEHQDVPFEKIVDRVVESRDISRNPLFQVMFTLQNNPEIPVLKLGELDFSIEPVMQDTAQFDLSFDVTELEEGFNIEVEYCKDLFAADTIERMFRHYETLLNAVVENPNQEIGKLSMLPDNEKKLILGQSPDKEGNWFNQKNQDLNNNEPINVRFEKIVALHKDHTAVTFREESWTYDELNKWSNQIANTLQHLGIQQGEMVGVYMERSFDFVSSLLGIMKSGAVYVPLDTQNPAGRIEKMIDNSSLKTVITTNTQIVKLKKIACSNLLLMEPCGLKQREEYELQGLKVIDLEEMKARNNENIPNINALESWAYMLFTSGSTGEPKGAITRHNGALNHILAEYETLELADGFRFLQSAGIGSDISVWQMLGPLLKAGTVVIIDKIDLLDYACMLEKLKVNQVNLVEFVPSYAWGLITYLKGLPEMLDLSPLEWIMLTGEEAPVKLVNEWKLYYPKVRIINCYGPCEASDDVVQYEVELPFPTNQIRVPIGRPITNMNVLVLDENNGLCPISIAGEICITGVGVGAGYWNMPEKTAASFINNPFPETLGEAMYKTGDLGRWLPNGNLEFLGRIDRQVKIRGHRIELGEIESFIRRKVEVKQTHTLVHQNEKKENFLLTFIVLQDEKAEHSLVEKDLKLHCQAGLPDFMQPAYYCFVEEIPLNLSDKVDAKKLLSNFSIKDHNDKQENFVECENPTEQHLCDIWKKVLHKNKISADADFFILGGHSLLVMSVRSAIKKQLELDIDILDLFIYKSIKTLAAFIDNKAHKAAPVSMPSIQQRPARIPLSFAQERLWFIDKLEGSIPYHMSVVFELNGALDTEILQYAFNEIINRHEILRTRYKEYDGIPYQDIMPENRWEMTCQELESGSLKKNLSIVDEIIADELKKPFDLVKEHLIRVLLLKIQEGKHKLVLVMHHIAFDGWSEHIMVRELLEIYAAKKENNTLPSNKLKLQYADYAVWQRNYLQAEVLEEKLRYWEIKLQGLVPMDLPLDFSRPQVLSTNGNHLDFKIDKALYNQLENLSKQHEVTMFMLLLAVFKILLYKYTGQTDICVGSPMANRTQEDIEGLIGFFVNTLPLRSDLSKNLQFCELLKQIKTTTLEAYKHQDTPFGKIVDRVEKERNMSRNPLFQVLFVLQNVPETPMIQLEDLTFVTEEVVEETSKFDLTFDLNQTGNGLDVSIEYNNDLFLPQTIEKMKQHFITLLSSVVQNPEQNISQLKMLSDKELQQLLVEFNDTEESYPQDKSVIDIFENQTRKTPDNIALTFREKQLSYRELNEQANRIANYCKSTYQIKNNDLVGIMLEKSEWCIISILAILKLGATYVPIDTKFPTERKLLIIKDTGVKTVIVDSEDALPSQGINVNLIPLNSLTEVVCHKDNQCHDWESIVDPLSHAYIMYTSGSSGQPKGVLIKNQSIVRLIFNKSFDFLNEQSVIYQYAPLAFDASTFEIWGALLKGGKLVISEPDLNTLDDIASEVRTQKVNTLWLTAGLFHVAVNDCPDLFNGLKYVLSGGDSINSEIVFKLLDSHKDLTFINGYGPTESTTFAIANRISHVENISFQADIIGKPIGNTRAYILNAASTELMPSGCYGELCLAGPGLSSGYKNQENLTQQKFVENPFATACYEKLYRTGDWARWLSDGTIEFIGRKDQQVKIRGYRIELGEIEKALEKIALVKQCVVVADKLSGKEKKLCAYIVPNGKFDKEELQKTLELQLPDYMIPALMMEMEELPLNSNGKIDRKALPDFDALSLNTSQYVAPRNEVEKHMAKIWQDLLNIERVGIDDNFFDLGGDSIITIQIVSRAKQFGYYLKPRDLFLHQTLRPLSEVIKKNVNAITAEQGLLHGSANLLPIQHWFFEKSYLEQSFFNQAVLLQISKTVTDSDLRKVIEAIIVQHDALRFFYVKEKNTWTQYYGDKIKGLEVVDLKHIPANLVGREISDACTEFHKNLDIKEGELFRNVLMKTPETESHNRLFILAHHLAIDGVSWRILLEQIDSALNDLSKKKPVNLGPKTSSYREWVNFLTEYSTSENIVSQHAYWQAVLSDYFPLPTDKKVKKEVTSLKKDVLYHTLNLNRKLTTALLKDVNQPYNTEINDILLSALTRTMTNWVGEDKIVIGLEGHGREDISNNIDLINSVGWFTNLYPVSLAVENNKDQGALIKSVKEQLRAIPDKGIGYGLLRYLHPSELIRNTLAKAKWDIIFNYLGQTDNIINTSLWLKQATEFTGESEGELFPFNSKLEINCSVSEGRLSFVWAYSQRQYEKETIELLANQYIDNLITLINHCLDKSNIEFTPFDFGLSGKISHEELEEFLTENETEGDEILKF